MFSHLEEKEFARGQGPTVRENLVILGKMSSLGNRFLLKRLNLIL